MSLTDYTILPPWRSYRCESCGRDYSFRHPEPTTPTICAACRRIQAQAFNRSAQA